MQLQEAIAIIQKKFMAETQGQVEGEAIEAYQNAFDQYPVVMEVATAAFADEIIQRNYEARKQMMAKQQAEGGGEGGATPPPIN